MQKRNGTHGSMAWISFSLSPFFTRVANEITWGGHDVFLVAVAHASMEWKRASYQSCK